MRIEIVGDDSIGPQARTYAEYRISAALSRAVATGHVRTASLLLRRRAPGRQRNGVACTLVLELADGEVTRLRTFGDHPYAAINRTVERLERNHGLVQMGAERCGPRVRNA